MTFSDADLAHTRTLQSLYHELMKAGRISDLTAAERILSEAESTGCQAVDVLIAIVAPMLYQIGEESERGAATVAEEHRFTAFCAKLCELVGRRVATSTAAESGEAVVGEDYDYERRWQSPYPGHSHPGLMDGEPWAVS